MKSTIKLLIVEDSEDELSACRDTIDVYQHNNQLCIDLVACHNVEEAFSKLNGSFDGAIIDLRLGNKGNEGNEIVQAIKTQNIRIPIVILTGTPNAVDKDFTYIKVFKKGEIGSGYTNLFDMFFEIYNTGLTRIMGSRGKIEQYLTQVFEKNLIPRLETWKKYGKDSTSRTEKALLRYTLNHMFQLLDEDEDNYFPEEVYLHPPLADGIHTGSIVKDKDPKDASFIVLNPACDLVIRNNGEFKADRILLVEIEKQQGILEPELSVIKKPDKKKNKLKDIFGNNFTDYLHWLPETDFFEGGFINFRYISTLSKEEFNQRFEEPAIQISPSYIKDIVARFSGFYARQGQPDIKSDVSVERYC